MSADTLGIVKRFRKKFYYGVFFASDDEDYHKLGKNHYRYGPFNSAMEAFKHAEENTYFEYGVTFHENCYPPNVKDHRDAASPCLSSECKQNPDGTYSDSDQI